MTQGKMRSLIRRFVEWLRSADEWICAHSDLCDICKELPAERQCPCGRRVCDECADFYMYTDEDCCKTCSSELRQAWKDCKGHEWDEPSENDDGDMIRQCKFCDCPSVVESQA